MEVDILSDKIKQQLSSWFHRRDRSLYLPPSAFYYLNNGAYLSNAFISETVLSASAASVTFSNIPQGFRNLLIFSRARSDTVAEQDILVPRFNGDSGANYDIQILTANNATLTGLAVRANTNGGGGRIEAAQSRGNNFSPVQTWIYDYSRAGVEKWNMSFSANFGDVSADADLRWEVRVGRWRNTNVITSATLLPATGPNFVSGSRFQLYGIL